MHLGALRSTAALKSTTGHQLYSMLSCISACVEHEAVETAVHHDVYNIVNRLRQTGTLAAECEVCLRRQLRQQQKRLHHLQMLQLMLSWTHGSCGSRSVIAKQMPSGPSAGSLVCCPIYTNTRHLDNTLACSEASACQWDVAKTRPRAFNKWRAQAPRQGSLQGLEYA